jgi:hypothetical protein
MSYRIASAPVAGPARPGKIVHVKPPVNQASEVGVDGD